MRVLLGVKPSQFRNTVSVVAYTTDEQGESFPASVNGTVTGSLGTVPLQGMTTHGTVSPAIWTVARPSPWGEPVTVRVNGFNGSAHASATKQG